MRSLDDFTDKEKRRPVEISCACPQCGGSECVLYKSEQKDIFEAKCTDCNHKFTVRLPGLGDVL